MASKISIVDGNDAFIGTSDNPVVTSPSTPTGYTWAESTVSLSGSSQTALAANSSRKAVWLINPSTVNSVTVRLLGGTATATNGMKLNPGDERIISKPECSVTAITCIGTSGQSLIVLEGV